MTKSLLSEDPLNRSTTAWAVAPIDADSFIVSSA
jgi:hypothetical protein